MKTIEEKKFIKLYDVSIYPRPSVAVDLLICTLINTELHILLLKREAYPFKGMHALPGGFVRVTSKGSEEEGEDLDATALRILQQKTHLPNASIHLEQLYTFGNRSRDPRTRVISVAYFALLPQDLVRAVELNADATDQWVSISSLLADESDLSGSSARVHPQGKASLAFDHREMIELLLKRLDGKLDYTEIAFSLVPKHFTVSELRAVYESIKNSAYDPSNFRRRFKRWLEDGVIEQTSGKRVTGSRPAKVYQKVER